MRARLGDRIPVAGLGRHVFGLAALALGVLGLASGDFASTWQPVPDDLPVRVTLAYAAALMFVLSGAALQSRRTARFGAIGAGILYAIFSLLWARRVIGFPSILGTWLGFAEESALLIGAVFVYASVRHQPRLAQASRFAFGVCLLVFGAAHLVYVKETAALVPAWLPPGTKFWALATGAAHIAAGLALLSGIRALLAARLLTAMFVGFGLLVWLPKLFGHPDHMDWGGNAVNLALIGAAWVIADSLSNARARPFG